MLRQPAVAGFFYPGSKDQLAGMLRAMMPAGSTAAPALGVMLPHAGYIYSGEIAAETLSRVELPERIVLLGPNHHGSGADFAVSRATAWKTPLGESEIDGELANLIVDSIPQAEFDDNAHLEEHSLEVLVPLIQWLRPEARIVPISIKSFALEPLLDFGSRLAGSLRTLEDRPLLVTSSDMSHYLPGQQARDKDFLAIEAIRKLAPDELYRTVRENRISMCGVAPCVAMLQAGLQLGASSAELVRYGNSGEKTGDQSSVVGYAGIVVS